MQCIMSLLVLSAGIMHNLVASDSTIPSQSEQANLLLNVQEVFEHIKLLIKDESVSTDASVIQDIKLLVGRANYTLNLLEEMALLRLSSGSNAVCMLDSRPIIKQLADEGRLALKGCIRRGSEDIQISSNQLANVTNFSIDRGQMLLDALGNCSRKSGLAVISCYRNIIKTDVVPVKRTLLGAIEAHRAAHFKAVGVRNTANECVDDIVKKYRDLLERSLEDAFRCT